MFVPAGVGVVRFVICTVVTGAAVARAAVAGAVVAGGTIVSIGAIAAARRHSNSQQEQGRPSAGDLGTSPTDGP